MEKYVLEALCRMGYHQDAIDRMKLRYGAMVDSQLTTLWEGWGIGSEGFGGGSYNHAWSGGPLTILSSCIAGIRAVDPGFATFSVCPNPDNLSYMAVTVPLSGGRSVGAVVEKVPGRFTLELTVPEGTSAILELPVGCSGIEAGGRPVEPGTRLEPGKWQVRYR